MPVWGFFLYEAHANEWTGSRGEITSPMYPYPFVQSDDFTWRVSVDADRRLRITFLQVELG